MITWILFALGPRRHKFAGVNDIWRNLRYFGVLLGSMSAVAGAVGFFTMEVEANLTSSLTGENDILTYVAKPLNGCLIFAITCLAALMILGGIYWAAKFKEDHRAKHTLQTVINISGMACIIGAGVWGGDLVKLGDMYTDEWLREHCLGQYAGFGLLAFVALFWIYSKAFENVHNGAGHNQYVKYFTIGFAAFTVATLLTYSFTAGDATVPCVLAAVALVALPIGVLFAMKCMKGAELVVPDVVNEV